MKIDINEKGEPVVDYQEEIVENTQKKSGVIPYYDQMFIRKLYGGIPIYDTSTNINPKVGQIYLVSCGSSKRFCARFSNITVSNSLT